MHVIARMQLKRITNKMLSEYQVNNDNLPVDVVIEIERTSLRKEWSWCARYVHQNDPQGKQDFWRKAWLSHRCERGGLIPNSFSWSRSGSIAGTCKSEKEATIQATYAKALLLDDLGPLIVLGVYHELSESDAYGRLQ